MNASASTKASIREILFTHYEFADCVLTGVIWEGFGTTVKLEINYIYSDAEGFYLDSRGEPKMKERPRRVDLDKVCRKTIQFDLVQEYHLHNHLNDSQLGSIASVDWGFAEVQCIHIQDDSLFLVGYRNRMVPFHQVVIAFSGDRRIDLVFNSLRVT
jgi:hypothetical protein